MLSEGFFFSLLFFFLCHCPSVHWTVALRQEMDELKINPHRLLLNHVWHEDGKKKIMANPKRERKKKICYTDPLMFFLLQTAGLTRQAIMIGG